MGFEKNIKFKELYTSRQLVIYICIIYVRDLVLEQLATRKDLCPGVLHSVQRLDYYVVFVSRPDASSLFFLSQNLIRSFFFQM